MKVVFADHWYFELRHVAECLLKRFNISLQGHYDQVVKCKIQDQNMWKSHLIKFIPPYIPWIIYFLPEILAKARSTSLQETHNTQRQQRSEEMEIPTHLSYIQHGVKERALCCKLHADCHQLFES